MPFTTQLEPMGARAGANIGQFLLGMATNYVAQADRKKEETKQLNDKAGAFDRLAKSDPTFLQTLQIDEDEWKGMGSRQKVQAFEAYSEKMGMERIKANLAQVQSQTASMDASRSRTAAQDEQFARGLRELQGVNVPQASGGAGPMGTPMMMGRPQGDRRAAMLQQVMANNPAAAPQIAEILKTVQGASQTPAIPGTLREVGIDGYVFGVQSPSGAGSFLPVAGAGGARAAVAAPRPADQLRASKDIRELEKELEALFRIPVGEFTAADRIKGENIKRQIAELRRIGGVSGSAREEVSTGNQADPLGLFQ